MYKNSKVNKTEQLVPKQLHIQICKIGLCWIVVTDVQITEAAMTLTHINNFKAHGVKLT